MKPKHRMSNLSWVGLLTLATLALVFLMSCSAGDKPSQDSESRTAAKPLVVAMELQFPPFEMTDEQGTPRGISVEMAKALGEFLGRPVEIQNTAWVGLIPSLQSGGADVVISSMTVTEERRQVVDFSIPYAQSGLTLLLSAQSPAQNFSDLNKPGRVVAVKSGTTGAIVAQEKLLQADIRIFEDVAACVLEVVQGKADAFIYDALTVYESHKNNPATTRLNIQSIPDTFGYWAAALKKGNDTLLAQVNDFIREYRSQGGFERLGDEYLGSVKAVFEEQDVPFFFDIQE
ncbi:transporter substrate-binding domain-containing protein [Spirochaeta lutea]|nr:transporter substrate-binding domain-containing protein [Spirochaeta lutea]